MNTLIYVNIRLLRIFPYFHYLFYCSLISSFFLASLLSFILDDQYEWLGCFLPYISSSSHQQQTHFPLLSLWFFFFTLIMLHFLIPFRYIMKCGFLCSPEFPSLIKKVSLKPGNTVCFTPLCV